MNQGNLSITELINQAEKYSASKNYTQAIASYEMALKKIPDDLNALYGLAVVYMTTNNLDLAFLTLRKALFHYPHHSYLHNTFAVLLKRQKKLDQALKQCEQALFLDVKSSAAWNTLGNIHRGKKHIATALVCYEKALALDSSSSLFQINTIKSYSELNDHETVIQLCDRFLVQTPKSIELLILKAMALRAKKQFEASISVYQKVLQLNPTHSDAHNNLGSAYLDLYDFDQAMMHYQKALENNVNSIVILLNIAHTYRFAQEFNKAIDAYRKIIAIDPDNAEAHFNLGCCYLMMGDYEKGWPEYEWRWLQPAQMNKRMTFSCPQWNGEMQVGKKLLIHSEQGFGDIIMFARFISLVKEKFGGTVFVETRLSLITLFSSINNVDQWVEKGGAYPDFDYYIPLMSLPAVLKTTLNTLPNHVPYFSPRSKILGEWKNNILTNKQKIKIGIVWSGSVTNPNRFRSCELQFFEKLFSIPNIDWFSFQKGDATAALANYPAIINLEEKLVDFENTAAAMMQMDLIISIDSATAHLAGALGLPTWLMLSYEPDWRWMLNRTDSAWYPTMRLFRQESRNNWESIFDALFSELSARVGNNEKK